MASTAKCEQVAVAVALGMKIVLPLVKDGVQLADGLAIFQKIESDAAVQKKFMDAITGISAIEGEIKNLDFFGGLRIFRAFMAEYKSA